MATLVDYVKKVIKRRKDILTRHIYEEENVKKKTKHKKRRKSIISKMAGSNHSHRLLEEEGE